MRPDDYSATYLSFRNKIFLYELVLLLSIIYWNNNLLK